MNFHEVKDLVMIYSSNQKGKPDYTWDKADIVVWNPLEQREMDLTFTGSERPNDEHSGKIHFIATYKNEGYVLDAFDNAVRVIFPNISNETLKEYEKVFMEEIIKAKQ